MLNIKEKILNAIPDNDYTVLNNSRFMAIIDDIGIDVFHNELNKLMESDLIRYEKASDGLMIFKN